MQVEFWHGNCTTFELESNEDVERMFESNLITMGNFYSGQVDRLNITCARNESRPRRRKPNRALDLVVLCLLVLVVCLMCFVACSCRRKSSFP